MDDIKLSIEVTVDKSAVVIGAQTSVAGDVEDRSYFLAPAQAVDFANTMLHAAEECGVTVQVQSTGISEAKRMMLVQRTMHVMRSTGNRKPLYTAAQVVDTILSEVL